MIPLLWKRLRLEGYRIYLGCTLALTNALPTPSREYPTFPRTQIEHTPLPQFEYYFDVIGSDVIFEKFPTESKERRLIVHERVDWLGSKDFPNDSIRR